MATRAYAIEDDDEGVPTPLQSVPSKAAAKDPEDLTGAVLAGRYRLRRLLDRGGMGNVYYAEHTAIGKRVAVKVLSAECAQSQSHRTRLLREAQACSRLAHENVIDIIDFGEAPNGSVFLAMELLRGETLATTLDRGPLAWARAKSIILQICRALHAAHNQGILHRDVKPDNCFRIKRGANRDFIKMFDFGLAKIFRDGDGGGRLTTSGTIFGTPEYMSPEQTRGEPVDHRSDLYSTGIILYELVTGIVPFRGEHFMEIFKQQVSDPPIPPSEVNPAVSPALEQVILKAIAKDPNDRYQSMQELATALTGVPTERQTMDNTRAGLAIIAGRNGTSSVPAEEAPRAQPGPAKPAEISPSNSGQRTFSEPMVPQQAMRDLIQAMNSRERIYLFIIVILGLSLLLMASAVVGQ